MDLERFIVAREASLVVDGIKHDCFSVDRESFPVKAPKCTEAPQKSSWVMDSI